VATLFHKMANPKIIPKKSSVAGKIPETTDLALGEVCINHTDRRLYTRNPATGEVYRLAGAKDAPDRIWMFDLDGDTTYLGYLLYSAFPNNSGSVFDATAWEIARTIFNSAGTTSQEASATGAWSSKQSLTYS
jgi:hypothetical protein